MRLRGRESNLRLEVGGEFVSVEVLQGDRWFLEAYLAIDLSDECLVLGIELLEVVGREEVAFQVVLVIHFVIDFLVLLSLPADEMAVQSHLSPDSLEESLDQNGTVV